MTPVASRLEDVPHDVSTDAGPATGPDAAGQDPLAFLEDACPELSPKARALCLSIKERFEMPWDDAISVARLLDDLFNGRGEVDDDELPKDLRAMFYDLQAKDLMRIRREEFKSPDGKNLRAYYWSLNDEALDEVRRQATQSRAQRAVARGANGNGSGDGRANGHAAGPGPNGHATGDANSNGNGANGNGANGNGHAVDPQVYDALPDDAWARAAA